MASSQNCKLILDFEDMYPTHTAHSTTTELTGSWSSSLAAAFGLDPSNKFFEYALRAV